MDFKVGDKVRMIVDGFEGTIEKVVEVDNPHYSCVYKVADKYKCFYGLYANELELIEKAKEPTTLEDLEQRIEKLEEIVNNCQNKQNNSQICKISAKNEEIISKSQLLTEDERVILRNMDKKWKWIVREKYGHDLWLHEEKPIKNNKENNWDLRGCAYRLSIYNNLFQLINWYDDEPYNIEELLKGECGNE